jgi:predicted RNA polymerase sigma factor
VPLTEQDRSLWERKPIEEGVALLAEAVARGAVGEYQLQAAIAAEHARAARPEDTDWREILALLADLDDSLEDHHRLHATRAHLLEMSGNADAAIAEYRRAADRTNSLPEQQYLTTQAARLNERRGG